MFSVFAAIPPFLMNHLEKKAFLRVGIFQTLFSLLSMSTQGCIKAAEVEAKQSEARVPCCVCRAVLSVICCIRAMKGTEDVRPL